MKGDRTLWLVFMAMLMFATGIVVFVTAKDLGEHLLAGVAIVGALAVVIANVFDNGKGRGQRDYSGDRGTDDRRDP